MPQSLPSGGLHGPNTFSERDPCSDESIVMIMMLSVAVVAWAWYGGGVDFPK